MTYKGSMIKTSVYKRWREFDDKKKTLIGFVLCNVFQKIISLVSMPFYTRLLSAEQYGRYSVYQSYTMICMVFLTLNLFYSGYMAGLTRFSEDEEKYSSACIGLVTILSFCGGLFLFGVNYLFRIVMPIRLTVYMVLEILSNAYYLFWATREKYYYRFKKLIIVTVFSLGICSALSIVLMSFVNYAYRLDIRVLANTVGWIIACLLGYEKKKICIKSFFDAAYWKYCLSTNVPLIPHYLSGVVLNQSDRIMINKYVGANETAYYSIAYSASMALAVITSAIKNAFDPIMYKALKKQDDERYIKRTISSMLSIVAFLCILATLMCPEIISILAPAGYNSASKVMPSLCCSVFFIFSYNLFSTIEFYYRKSKLIMAVSIVAALTNVVLNMVLIPEFGFIAAGYTTLFSYMVFSLLHMMISKYVISKEKIRDYLDIKAFAMYSVIVVVLCNICILLYDYFDIRIIAFVVLLISLLLHKQTGRFNLK